MDTRRDQAKEQILQATITCIEKWGIAGVTARRVAQIAGVNIASINYYFGTKENLLNETFKATSKHLSVDTGMLLSAKDLSSFSLIKIFLTFLSIGIHKYPRLVHTFINNSEVAPEYLLSLG
jgi:AcrR family transcriptional regulator